MTDVTFRVKAVLDADLSGATKALKKLEADVAQALRGQDLTPPPSSRSVKSVPSLEQQARLAVSAAQAKVLVEGKGRSLTADDLEKGVLSAIKPVSESFTSKDLKTKFEREVKTILAGMRKSFESLPPDQRQVQLLQSALRQTASGWAEVASVGSQTRRAMESYARTAAASQGKATPGPAPTTKSSSTSQASQAEAEKKTTKAKQREAKAAEDSARAAEAEIAKRLSAQFFGTGVPRSQPPASTSRGYKLPKPTEAAEALSDVLGGGLPKGYIDWQFGSNQRQAFKLLREEGYTVPSEIPTDSKKRTFRLSNDPDKAESLAGKIEDLIPNLPANAEKLRGALEFLVSKIRQHAAEIGAIPKAGAGGGSSSGGGKGGGAGKGAGGGKGGYDDDDDDDIPDNETPKERENRLKEAVKKRFKKIKDQIASHARFLEEAEPDLTDLSGPELLAVLNRYDAAIRERISEAEAFLPLAKEIGEHRGRARVTNLETQNSAVATALGDGVYRSGLADAKQLQIQEKLAATRGLDDKKTVDATAETNVALAEFRAAVYAAAKATREFAAAEFKGQKVQADTNARKQAAVLDEYKKAQDAYQKNLTVLGPSHPVTEQSKGVLDQTIIGLRAQEAQTKRDIEIARKRRENDLARTAGQPLPYEEAHEPTRFSKFLNRLRGRPPLEGSSLDPRTGGLRGGGGRGDFGGGGESLKTFFGQGVASGLKYGLPNMLLYGGGQKIGEIVRESAQLEVAFARLNDQYETIFGPSAQQKVAELRQEISDLAVSTGQSAVEIADAARQVNAAFGEGSVGPEGKEVALLVSSARGEKKTLSGEDLGKNQLEAVTKLARVSGQTIDATQDQARTLGFTFGLSAEAIGDAAIHMEKLTSVPTGNLIRGLSDSAVSAKAAGFEFNEFASVFAAAEKRSGARGVAGVADSFNRSLPVLTKNKQALIEIAQSNEKLGKNTQFWEGITKSKASDILLGLAKEYENLTKSQKDNIEAMIGDPKSFKDLIAALQNSQEISRTTRELDSGNQEGALDERTKQALNTLRGALDQFAQKIRTLGQAILASPLGDFLRGAVQAGTVLLRVLEGVFGVIGKVNDITGGFLSSFLGVVAAAKGLSVALQALAGKNILGGALSTVAGLLGGGDIRAKALASRPAKPLPYAPGVASFLPEFAAAQFSSTPPRRPFRDWLTERRNSANSAWLNFLGRGPGQTGFGGFGAAAGRLGQAALPLDALAEGQRRFWRWGAAAGPGAQGLSAAQRGGFGLGLSGIGSLGGISAGGLAGAAIPAGLIGYVVGDQIASDYVDKQKANWIKQSDSKIQKAIENPSSGRKWAIAWSFLGFGDDPNQLDLEELNRRRIERLNKDGRNPYQAIRQEGLSKSFARRASKELDVDSFKALVDLSQDGLTADPVQQILKESLGDYRGRLRDFKAEKAPSKAEMQALIKKGGGTGKFTEDQIDDLIKGQSKQGAEGALAALFELVQGDKKLTKKIADAMKKQGVDAAGEEGLRNLESYFNSNEGRTLQATIDSYAIGETSAGAVLKAYDNQIEDLHNIIEQAKKDGAEDVALIEALAKAKRQRMDFYSQQLSQTQTTLRAIAGLEAGFDTSADLQVALDQASARAGDEGLAPEVRQQAVSEIISLYQQILQNKLNDVKLSFEEKLKILNEGLSIPEEQGRLIGEGKASALMTGDKSSGTLDFYRNEYDKAVATSGGPDWDSVLALVQAGERAPEEALEAARKFYSEAEEAYQAKRKANEKGGPKKGTTELRNKRDNALDLLGQLQGSGMGGLGLEGYQKEYEAAIASAGGPDWQSVLDLVKAGNEAPEQALTAARKFYADAEAAYQGKLRANAEGKSKEGTTALKNARDRAGQLLGIINSSGASSIEDAIEASDILNRAADAYSDLVGGDGEAWVKQIYGLMYAGDASAQAARAKIHVLTAKAETAYNAAKAKAALSPFGNEAAKAVAAGAKGVVETLQAFGKAMEEVQEQAIEAEKEVRRAAIQNMISIYQQQQQAQARAVELTGQIGAARGGGRNPFQNLAVQKQASSASEKLFREMAARYRTPELIAEFGEQQAEFQALTYENQANEQVLRQLELRNQEEIAMRDVAKSISERRKSEFELLKVQMGKRGSGVDQLDLEAQMLQLDLNEALNEQRFASAGEDRAAANRAAAQVNSIRGQIIENQRARSQAIRDLAEAQSGLMKALADAAGDTVKSAQISLKQSRDELDYMLANPAQFSDPEITSKRAEVVSNAAAVRDAQYRKSADDIDFNLTLEKITKNQAIVQLQAMRQMYADNEQITREIDRKIHELQKSSNDAFNLPDKLKLPTLYEVRRLSQSVSAGDPFTGQPPVRGGYIDNRQVDIKITVQDGTSKEEMVSVLNDALQVNRRGFGNSQY